ncbi:hypothetical protein G7Y89_g13945 [Cudoniella acicularis]|uniref:DUF7730 domain-containing protein n=1 Tax=Cudoniella acicularis TaxID=354080 RepID=A0A8H4R5Y7_9HELO|nr:hypothetical protein G7Y89_g13945 [Cudoniella acicularis]
MDKPNFPLARKREFIQTSPYITTQPPKTTFLSLPPEIRIIIYHLALPSRTIIPITAPPKSKPKTQRTALLRTTKQIYTEASFYFYTRNTFRFSNGSFGSRSHANPQGLQHFLKRVPAKHLALIRRAAIDIYLHFYYWGDEGAAVSWLHGPPQWGSPAIGDALRMADQVTKHLTGLKFISLEWFEGFDTYHPIGNQPIYLHHRWRIEHVLQSSRNAKCSIGIMERLLPGKMLKMIVMEERMAKMMKAALDKLMERNGLAGNILHKVDSSGRAWVVHYLFVRKDFKDILSGSSPLG